MGKINQVAAEGSSRLLVLAATAILVACASRSGTATRASSSPISSQAAAGRSGGAGPNARSGPAAGGAVGMVDSVSTSRFTLTTSAGVKVIVDETSSTTYQNGTSSTSASAITAGESVLVLGTTNGATITATRVVVQPTSGTD
jgi:hypothetical protein